MASVGILLLAASTNGTMPVYEPTIDLVDICVERTARHRYRRRRSCARAAAGAGDAPLDDLHTRPGERAARGASVSLPAGRVDHRAHRRRAVRARLPARQAA